MVVVTRTSRTVFGDVLEVVAQIFFTSWTEEQVRQAENGADANLLGMFGQFVSFRNAATGNLNHAHDFVFATDLHPFLSDAFTLVDAETGSFASCSIDQNTLDSLLLQPATVLVDHFAVDLLPAKMKTNYLFFVWKAATMRREYSLVRGEWCEHWAHQTFEMEVYGFHVENRLFSFGFACKTVSLHC